MSAANLDCTAPPAQRRRGRAAKPREWAGAEPMRLPGGCGAVGARSPNVYGNLLNCLDS